MIRFLKILFTWNEQLTIFLMYVIDQFIIYINRWGNGTLAYWWVMIWNFVVLSLKLWHDCNVHQMQREHNNGDDIMT